MNHKIPFNHKGFLTLWVVIVLSLVPVVTLILANYGTVVTKMTRILQSGGTKHQLNVLHDIIASKTLDPDNDGRLEPLKEKTGNLLPDSIPAKKQDEWGTDFRYCTWDLGSYNSTDATYSQNNVLPPKADLAAKIISAGKDRVFQTNCTDANSAGDDLVNEIFETSITSVAGSGWIDDGSVVRLINSADSVGIGTNTPGANLDVVGTIRSSASIDINWSPNSSGWIIEGGNTSATTIRFDADKARFWTPAGGEIFTLLENGNIGIGAGTPGQKLDVAGTIRAIDMGIAGTPSIIVGDDTFFTDIDVANMVGLYGYANQDRAGLRLGSDGSYIFGDGGNIGIGTTAPGQKLHVNGGLKIGNTTTASAGSIRWNGTNFEGHNGSTWIQLDGSSSTPAGATQTFAQATCPSGWLKANGATISRTTYSSLFSAIGTTYGAGDGSTTFRLPDLRGEFVRGWDDGRGVDSGRARGSFQSQNLENHRHTLNYTETSVYYRASPYQGAIVSVGTSGIDLSYGGENRPRNVALLYCIKY